MFCILKLQGASHIQVNVLVSDFEQLNLPKNFQISLYVRSRAYYENATVAIYDVKKDFNIFYFTFIIRKKKETEKYFILFFVNFLFDVFF